MMNVFRWLKKLSPWRDLDCLEVRKQSSDYLEESLPPRKQSAIREHLRRCGPCRAFVESLASTIGLLSRLPRVAPPPRFKESVMERVQGKDGTGEG